MKFYVGSLFITIFLLEIKMFRYHDDSSCSSDIIYAPGESCLEFESVKPFDYGVGNSSSRRQKTDNVIVCKSVNNSSSKKKNSFKDLSRDLRRLLRNSYCILEKMIGYQLGELIGGIIKEFDCINLQISVEIKQELENLEKYLMKLLGSSIYKALEAIEGTIKKGNLNLLKEQETVLLKTYNDTSSYINYLISLGSSAFIPIVNNTTTGLLPTVLGYIKTAQLAMPVLVSDATKMISYNVEKIISAEKDGLLLKFDSAVKAAANNVIGVLKNHEGSELKQTSDIINKKICYLLSEINIIIVNVEREICNLLRALPSGKDNLTQQGTKKVCRVY